MKTKLRELKQLAGILGERLRDQSPDERLLLRCMEPVWPYIYPYGTLSYIKAHAQETPEQTDRLKMEKLQRAVTGGRRKWRSFVIGLLHTYRDRHSLQRTRARLVNRAARQGPSLAALEMAALLEAFREQALLCARAVEDARLEMFDFQAVKERIKLAKTVRNEENIPRFLRLRPYLDYGQVLEMLPAELLELARSRYDKPTPQTLCFDALQEYICLDDGLWERFKKLLEGYPHTKHQDCLQ